MSLDVFVFPTSFAQQRLWFLDQFLPGHAYYNMPFVVRLAKPVDTAALTRAVGELIRRHESLRTTFAAVDDMPVQVIAPTLDPPVSTIDLRTRPEADREPEAQRLAAEERTRPFDLARGPLFRVTLVRLGDAGDMLLLTLHHIVCDGWSMEVLFRELSELYDAFASQRAPALPELTVQYADFAVWQREWLRDEVLEQQMAYWRTQLAGVAGRLALPTDRPRPATPLLHAARRTLQWTTPRSGAVRALARREGSTVFLVLLSAFNTLLARHSGQTDIVVGTPIANRAATETEPLIGFFVNTLAIRTDLSEDPTFIELLGRVRETAARAFANQDVPFERVVAELTRERDVNRSPLFQVMFAMQSVSGGAGVRDAAERDDESRPGGRDWDGHEGGAKFDLTMSLVDDGVEITGWVEYARELFDRVTIERLIDHFERLIDAIVAAPNARLSSLPMTSSAERARVLEEWNATTTAYPRDRTVHALFEEQAARTPEVIAVTYGTDSITYGELNTRANRLARHLRRRGAIQGALAGVLLTPSLDMIVALLAVLKAGAAYVPLDPADPPERLRFMLEDVAVAVVVTTSQHHALECGGRAVVCVDTNADAIAREPAGNLAHDGTATDLAYMMYTSGSTGEPKGVAVPHRAVVRLVRETDYLDFSTTHIFAQVSHASFDAATFEIWGALLSGSRLVGIPKAIALSPPGLAAAIQDGGITVLFITTALFNHIARELPSAFTGVQTLLTGGEAPDAAAMRRVLDESRPGRLLNVYGPTESTTFATWHHVESVASDDATIPMGRPIANTRAYVLDASGELAPIGVPGELFLGGDGIASGYWRRPELTAERFLPDPFSNESCDTAHSNSESAAMMYRTGDIVRYTPDGSLVFVGRRDDQIKLRGFRVEPGEVEAALRTHPDVASAAVIAIASPDDKRLVAYLVMARDSERQEAALPADAELQACLQRRLPAWMTPSEFVWLDAMPLTPSGKIDRRALPGAIGRHADRDRAYGDGDADGRDTSDAPGTPTEQAIAGVWRDVLGVDRVGVNDGFFAIGGHSLLAAQVISRIRDRLRVDVSIQVLFTHPGLREFAREIDRQRGDPGAADAAAGTAPIRRTVAAGGAGPRQTSFAQQRLWFLAQLDPDSTTYNITDVIPLRGVDEALVQRALDEIVRRHDVLRTTIAAIDGVPMQIIAPPHPVELAREDCRGRTANARARRAAEARAREASRPFDLASGPLFRARLLRLIAQESHLCLTLHHAIADGWSLRVLRTELETLLDAYAHETPASPPLPELPLQYGDYAEWQRERMDRGGLDDSLAWWKQHLRDAPTVLDLPSDRPRPAVQTYGGATLGMRIAPGVADGLAMLGEKHGATRFMTLLASFAVLLARYSGQRDLIVGVAAAGRTHTELEPLIGMFVNTLPVRVVLSDDPPFEALLEQVKQSAVGAFAHEDLPFDRLVSELAPSRDASVAPLVQVLFDLQRMPDARVIEAPAGEIVDQGEGAAKFELTLAMAEDAGGLAASLEYNRERIDAAAARRLLLNFHRLLSAIVEDAALPCSQLPLLADDERKTLLSEWNSAPDLSPQSRTPRKSRVSLTSLVDAQVRRTPLAPAIVDADGALGYTDLEARVNRLAHRLIAHGVGPEQPVAVCASRSRDFVVALLGILKAGAAYVCLDPDQPPDRLSALFRASGARLLLTQQSLDDTAWSASDTLFIDDPADAHDAAALDEAEADIPPLDGRVADPHGLAAIVFTSGSTGHPKGVAIEQHSLLHLARTMAREYELAPSDRVLQMAAVNFDVTAEEIFPTLTAGSALVPWPDRMPPTIDELLAFVERFRITVLNLPSPYWHALADALERQPRALPASLRLVIAGSDKTSFDRLAAWQRAVGSGVRWLNAYGVTEATVTSTLYEPPSGPLARGNTPWLPVGRPVGGVHAYVLDEHRALVPIGVAGELYLGGEGIAREYVNEPQLTAERFVPDPFQPAGTARLYRTGDRARLRIDGNLELLGRFDDQIKVRGFRVEPAEVERALEHHPSVRESAVVARQDGPGDPRLAAFVVPRNWPAPAGAELRRFLQARLPDYMVPAIFVALREFPTTAAGKVDRARLPAADSGGEAGRPYVPPRTPAERQLAELWARVLGVDRVGATDNFFELGGDSILSIQIIARAAEIGLHYTARQLFQHQTVAELAPLAGAARQIVAEQGIVTGPVPLTPVQRWFFEQSPIDAHHSNQSVLLRCDRAMDPAVLERAFAHIVETHDALRLRFHLEGDTVRQEIAAPGSVPFARVDLRDTPASERDAAFERVTSECQASLDLAAGPIVRACYIDLEESSRLLIVVHHLAVDGVSWRIILGDLAAACAQLARGEAVTLPPKTTSFQQWARRLTEYAATPEIAGELARWSSASADVQPLPRDVPTDIDTPRANTEDSARSVHAALDRAETEALLHRVPHAYRTQINDVLLCALARGFRSRTGVREIVVHLEGHGREPLFDDVDLSRTVGWFTTIYPVRLDAGEAEAPGEALKRTKEYLRGLPNKGIGYGLLRYLHPDEQIAAPLQHAANVEVSFNYLGQFEDAAAEARELETADEWAGPQRAPRALRPYVLDVTGAIFGGQLSLSVMYSSALHRRATMQALVDHVAAALRELIEHCLAADGRDCTPSDFPLARLDQNTLTRLTTAYRHIEDIYPVSPMQAGLLFHTLLSPDAGEYVEQLAVDLDANLDIDAFERAWSAVTERHPALRTGFVWRDVDEPLQIVWRQVTSRWDVQDWTRVGDATARTREWLRDDRRRGYDLDEPPLMRFAIAKLATGQWRLLWSCHHLVLDGWSVPLVLREVWEFYEAFREGRDVALAHPRPYRDYIAWLSRQDLDAAEAFWRDVLRGFSTPTPLVVDTRAPGSAGGSGGGHAHGESRRTLHAETTTALQALARQHRVTLNTIVQAAWALILSRYSGRLDVVFGATVSGRPPELRGVEAMVGLFINTLPVRVRVAPDARLADWLESLQEQQSAARQFEYSPLVAVQGWSDVPRGTSLFESVLVFENYPGDNGAPVGGDVDRGDAGEDRGGPPLPALERTSYPLTIAVVPGTRLLIKMTYDLDRLGPEAVERMLGHFETVLTAMTDVVSAASAHAAEQPLSSLPLLTPVEVEQAAARNQTAAGVPFGSCVEMFDAQVRLTPDAVAVESGDGTLTYAELDRLATRAAHRLRACGVAADVPVALAVDRGRWLAVGMLAILKAGGAYVPLASSYPAERIAFMLDDSTARVVVSQSSRRHQVPAAGLTIVCLDGNSDIADASGTAAALPIPLPNPPPHSLAYIIYTSGSTGRPKGVALPHAALANLVWWQNTASTPREGARVLQFAPVSFDVCFQECFSTWASGGTLVFISEETQRDPALLVGAIDADRVDRLFLPFVALQQLAETAIDSGGARALREIITAGEQLHITPALRRFFADRTGCVLHNQYGPSETHVATAFTLPDSPADWPELPPVGWPIANARTHVLDAAMRLVPDGVPGELFIGGDCLARGYWGRDALTADRFVVDPFRRNGHAGRIYRTGDLVRTRADGAIEFLGRVDDQVKIRGFRVEPGEVEAMLRQHPAVAQAAVVAREIRPGERSLLAYVVAAPLDAPAGVDAHELRRYLEARLPDWMVPAAFVWMDRLPLTPSGKVDRLALPAPDATAAPAIAFVPPRTTGERALAAIWSELLGVHQVDVRGQFFELGGHSLLATRMIARIRRELGLELPLRAVFETPVLEDLARRLNDLDARLARPAIIPRRAPNGPVAASFAQHRLWILEQLNQSTVFHVATTMAVEGETPIEVWRRAIDEIVRRHAVLRTTFAVVDGVPVQRVEDRVDVTLRVDDLRAQSSGAREDAYRTIANAEIRAPFDLSRGPLIRARLVRMTDDDSRLLLTLHHIVADGWSLSILKRELTLLADAFQRGEPSPLPDLPIQYADFSGWQRERLHGAALEEHLDYWRSQLDDCPSALDFPADRPRPPVQSYAGASIATRLPAGVARQLRSFGQQEGTTLFMTLLSAFAVLLSRLTGQDDLIVGSPVAGRTQAETEPLVGLFLNHLPIRIRLAGAPTFRDLAGRVREATLGAFAHQELPFELLLQHVNPERQTSVTPLFQVFFNHLNFGGPRVDTNAGEDTDAASPARIDISRPADTWSPFDFTLYSSEQADGIDLELAYRTSLYDTERMAELLAQFTAVVHQVCADPSIALDRISLLTDRSRAALPNPTAPLDDECPDAVHTMFERQALAHPAYLAVCDDEVAWTYGELESRSSRIARRLRNDGIGDGDVVAIYAHRSAALICAIVGVLKAGAAYLILDPGYPPLRLAEYIDTVGPAGWIAIDRAGAVASALRERIDARSWRSRLQIGASDSGDLLDTAAAVTPAARTPSAPNRDSIACVSFTSGSTGTPKAILQRHGGLSSFAPWVAKRFGVTERDRFTMLSGLSHDPLQRDIFTPLAIGASIHIPAADVIGTPGRLSAWIREQAITVANLTPAMAQMMAPRAPAHADRVALVFFVGEQLTRTEVARLRAWAPAAVCVNLYGATETQRALGYHIDSPAPATAAANGTHARREVLPVGRGVPGTQLLVLPAPDKLAGVGEIGEIYVRSPYLAAGYLAATSPGAERFIVNPFTRLPDDRMYRTGDLGRYLPDGCVELVGRVDAQMKIRGFRVEPAEVEARLARHPHVRDAAVALRDPANADAGLAAYVVPQGAVTAKELRRFVADSLPGYMVPSVFVLLDALPITPNGKLDRAVLRAAQPQPTMESAAQELDARGPRDAVEATLMSLWRQALELSAFGIDDNFFELGGHSLLAAQVLARVADALRIDIPLGRFFEHPTIAELSEAIAAARVDGLYAARPPITPIVRHRHRARQAAAGVLDIPAELRQTIRDMMRATVAPARTPERPRTHAAGARTHR